MAEQRKRDARARAEALFKTRQQIAQNAADRAWTLEYNQSAAAFQNDQDSRGCGAEFSLCRQFVRWTCHYRCCGNRIMG